MQRNNKYIPEQVLLFLYFCYAAFKNHEATILTILSGDYFAIDISSDILIFSKVAGK
jgi:hypothetical protein